MSFLSLGGDAGSRPTFFEVYAADKLVPSLRAAIVYSLSVFGQGRPWVARLLEYEDEVVAAATLLLDRHTLRGLEATFAESLYGLKRERRLPNGSTSNSNSNAQGPLQQQQQQRGAPTPAAPPLGRAGENWALAASVLLPYLAAKADRLYAARGPQQQRGVLGLALRRAAGPNGSAHASQPGSWRATFERAQGAALVAFLKAYPFLHASAEAAKLAFQLCYLLDAADAHSPVLWLLGQRAVRVSAQDMARLQQDKARRRGAALAAAGQRGALTRGAARLLLRARFAAADNVSSVLILAVFGFKALEWWYSTAEDRLAAGKVLPPPPPPPPPAPHPAGVPLPGDPSLCPLCRRPRVNPSVIAVSGYAFCYPCAFNWVAQRRCCPVTLVPATLDHIRRLFEAA